MPPLVKARLKIQEKKIKKNKRHPYLAYLPTHERDLFTLGSISVKHGRRVA